MVPGKVKRFVAEWLDLLTLVCMRFFNKQAACYVVIKNPVPWPYSRQRKAGSK